MVPVRIVESIAQFVASEGSQVAASIDEKLRSRHVVFLCGAVKKRRCRVGTAAAVDIHL